MADFPKWLLALAFLSLLPLLFCVFFLFGGKPFSAAGGGAPAVRLLLYLAGQTLWLAPTALFFFSLDRYRRGYRRIGVAAALLGDLITLFALLLLFR